MAEDPLPRLDPVQAIAYFKSKGWEIGFDWQDIWQEEHARAFTVAKAMSRDLLEDIRAEVDRAISDGTTLQQFSKALTPKLQARGWWGKALMDDPASGETKVVQLGSPARLRTIYETNLRTSYAAGKWQRIQRAKRTLPYLRYICMMDGRERPEHHSWHGTLLLIDNPWWDTHYTPCGWGCRCDTQQVNERMMARRGWTVTEPRRFPERDYVNKRTGEVTKLERGIDPGWAYNVGKAPLDGLTPAPRLGKGSYDDGALQAMLSDASFGRLRGFFTAFGLDTREAATAGKVWNDAAGWPVPIAAGLLRGADGQIVSISDTAARELTDAAKVLLDPKSIGWVWIKGDDGRAMLVRRYRSDAGVVDMGGSFWRWHFGSARGLTAGHVIWYANAT
ncbi:phage head morphogenesis protein [Novosphingobium clariflavum]|uniref:Phage minor head protein n=1 Tax=Novosphingobium clariflavum TaxID=2029884 RepID=A0ABV6SC57_9SPHN|nr:phage minor head protein [Novosphingobium clariflavum]